MNRQQINAGLALFLVLFGLYAVSYSGLPLGADERLMLDSIESLVRRGNFLVTMEFNTAPAFQPNGMPALDPKYEPLQMILSAPLFWLAQNLPQIGLVHTVFLLNIFVTSATAIVVYWMALLQDFELRVAWLGGLLFGVATLAWPYSRWFYREPLTGLLVLSSFVFAYLIRQAWDADKPYRKAGTFLALSLIAAVLTKQVAIFIVPGLFVMLIPTKSIPAHRLRVLIGVIGAVTITVLLLGSVLNLQESRFDWRFWFDQLFEPARWSWTLESLLGYQFSPSRSLWLYSPLLLAAIPGAILLFRRQEWRLVLGLTLVLMIFSAGYGVWRAGNWWGSWAWGPRYLLPLVPLLTLWILPVLEWLLEAHRSWIWRLAFILLVMISVGVQILGIALPYTNFYSELHHGVFTVELAPDVGAWPRWPDYNWNWSDSLLAYHIEHFRFDQLNLIWPLAQPRWLVPFLSMLVIAFGLVMAFFAMRRRLSSRSVGQALIGLALALPIVTVGGILFSLRSDPRYLQGKDDVGQLITELNQAVGREEAVFLDRAEYTLSFMNYFKSPALVITLPYAPGERYGAEEPQIVSGDLAALAGEISVSALEWAADHYSKMWLVASSSPFHEDKIRPVEHYLVEHYFPVSEITASQQARAITFSTVGAPSGNVSTPTSFRFGNDLHLNGYNLPQGSQFEPGDIVPISLIWTVSNDLSEDYNIGVFILNAGGRLVAQRNSAPLGTFGHTSQWQTGERYRDNHGLQLPANTPSGEYGLYVAVYRWQDGSRLEVTDDSQTIGDLAPLDTILIETSG